MRTATITPTLYLTEIPVTANEPAALRQENKGKNNIWIIDRSGSMHHELKNVIEDCVDRVNSLPAGDTLTVAWFSSEGGQYGYIVKGMKIVNADERIAITVMLRRYIGTVGATCFSEVLTDVSNVLGDLAAISPNFSLMFFSDGYPVVSSYRAELEKIEAAIGNIAGTLNSVLLVGYGDYYNRELMAKMAEQFGGGLIHSSNLKVFSAAFEKFVNESSGVQLRQSVKVPDAKNSLALFSVTGSQITVYQANEDREVLFAPTGHDDALYVLSETAPRGAKGASLGELEQGAYAAAYVLSQRMKADLALEILGKLGDVALIDNLNSAYTNEEAGRAEQAILQATTAPVWRYRGGKNTSHLPDPYAFCVLDALDLLSEDPEARFYPNDTAFVYKRIGRPAVPIKDYPRFEAETNASSPLSTLTWNDEKLNVSIKTAISGIVQLQGDYARYGFGPHFQTTKFRDFAIIADGVLNVLVLPVSMGAQTFERLKIAGVIDAEFYSKNKIYLVRLDRLPVINRGMANGLTSATKLCRDILAELELQGQLKALKFLRDELDPEKAILRKTEFTPEQEAFLAENGIDKNGRYAPETVRGEATDFYMAKHFQVKAKGFSSLPSIKDVRERLDKGKSPTPSGQLVIEGLAMFETMAPQGSTFEKLAWLDETIAGINKTLREIRKVTQRTKFAILLGRKWFDEFSSRDEKVITVDGVEFTIDVVEKKVDL